MRAFNSILIFPPQFEPFQPYLSLPTLSAVLKTRGHSVKIFDFNVDYFNWILRHDYIEQSLISLNVRKDNSYRFLIKRGEYALKRLTEARNIIKNQKTFADLPKYKWAINVLRTALEAVSGRFKPSKIDFYESRCGLNNFNSYEIYTAINNPSLNLFEEYISYIVLPTIKEESPDFVGFSLVVHDQLAFTLTLCREIRKCFPEIHICAGGSLVSKLGYELANSPYITKFFDSFVIGEGDETICELIETLAVNADILKIPGILVPRNKVSFKKRINKNVFSTILPDFSNFPLNKYLSPYLVLPYLTSKGCYWGKCTFCCHRYPYLEYEKKSIELVVDQLAELKQTYETRYFSFSDEAIPTRLMRDLSMKIIKRDLDIRWFTFARMEKAFKKPEFCNLIYKGGCRTLMFGMESAFQRIVDLMDKGTNVADVTEILSSCKQASISLRLDIMIGFPTETQKESDYTLKFVQKHRDLIDTPFSITPLSVFELQKDSPIMINPEKYWIHPKEPLRGDIDYQFDYKILQGINNKEKEKVYPKYIAVINSEFDNLVICPENKAHAFLMKCLYDEGLVSLQSFIKIKEKLDYNYIPKFYPGIECKPIYTNEEFGTNLLSNLQNGMELEINSSCIELLNLIKKGYSIAEVFIEYRRKNSILNNDIETSLIDFLHFLLNNDFIYLRSYLPKQQKNFLLKEKLEISEKFMAAKIETLDTVI